MEIEILLYEGFDELDAIGPYETFQTAAEAGGDLAASLVTHHPTERITASHGLRVEPDGELSEPDLLVVPGGGWSDRNDRGTWGEYERNDIPPLLAERYDRGATVASVCTGAMLSERAGLLDGRPAITHASALDDLRETAAEVVENVENAGEKRITSGRTNEAVPRVVDSEEHGPSGPTSETVPRVVDDGDLLTAGGVTSGIDLALWLLERELSGGLAEEVATTLEYERGAVYRS
ncbi:DJ-1/PfpI family protein [Halalkalicoccus jeotgali]|uniref:ThiJ/PfpI domain protein n=1 Tax=Halalkalicoccus jeotgali (strain DSM 18796 / CECT 7217 / JCM 14584 / KCTC 4019 / B3) TaxID=795797 RepID=D8J965_HALJB|nr:DJ-1/PfpI family protein [Halalkalicoccus jeotgali]ADJ16334.1 ThiJ/PfpI domain protein [Halalkalicoccus jeotgali B3]ELY37069.1 ThiJ/PfpI domain-containing protein [Halalkalicoccus jeotgali B3]